MTVLVVGAGPTGLALAAQLHAFGAAVRVVEQRTQDQPSRAFIVQPRTLELLAPSGVAAELVARGDPSARVQVTAGGRRAELGLSRPGVSDTPYPFLLAIPQVEVERALEAHLLDRGVRVEHGVSLVSLRQTAHAVHAELRHPNGETENAHVGYLVGCDGRESTVRTTAGVAFPTRVYRPRLLLADVDISASGGCPLDSGTVHGILERAGAVFLFPFQDGGWRLLTVLEDRDASLDDRSAAAATVARVSDGALAVTAVRWAARVELRRGQAATYQQGRVLLAGDAAHVHSPAGAQGMNTGLADAVNLGWKLALVATGTADPSLLGSYETERWPVARWTRRLTDLAFFLEASDRQPMGLLRRVAAPPLVPLLNGRVLPAAAFRLMGGLWTRYSHSPICDDDAPAWHRGLRPGARLPDGDLRVDRRPARLHGRLCPAGFHLLRCDRDGSAWPSAAVPPAVGPIPLTVHHLSVGSEHGALADRLGVRGTAQFLIRPDGYVAYRCTGTASAGLLRHLRHYGIGQ